MGKLGFLLNGVLLSGVLVFLLVGSEVIASPVVETGKADLSELEAEVASSPEPENVAALASKYLERQQPGLAQAVLDSAPDAASVQLSHVRSRVALAQGRVDEALAISEATLAECDKAEDRCSNWLYAKTVHQNHVLSSMKHAGLQDPAANPALTEIVLASSIREVRLAGSL